MRISSSLFVISLFVLSRIYAQHNYAEALQKSMFFYEAQQSGPLDPENRVSWRGNSAMADGSDVGHDLTGGWYDAGDHVKFGFPMAFSATVLAWGAIEFKEGYESSGQMTYLKNNLRWVNDYFIKCHTAPNEFYGQVGNGGADHAWWGSAEVMQMERPAYKIDESNPGSDLAAETAAAMAATSMIFKESDPAYSVTLLNHAKQLYDFADNYRGIYSESITDAAGYYKSFSGYNDELVWGALWLYQATQDVNYLNKAIGLYSNLGNEGSTGLKSYKWGMAWDDKSYGCYALLATLTNDAAYKADMERHLDYWTTGYDGQKINYTDGGLAYLDIWGALRYSLNTSFLALVYSPHATTTDKSSAYYDFAVNQINYALGSNPRQSSYVCGYGTNPPVNPHHRTAHGAWSNNQNGPPETTRHILYGALVGGPNNDDTYEDERSNYINNEVACDYNAGFSGVLAKMIEDFGGNELNNFPAEETPTDEFFVESKLNATGNTHTEWAVWIYNHTAWPARTANSYSFRLFIDISEGVDGGYSASDYVVSTNNGGVASFTELAPWDADENIYFTEVTLNPDVSLWPGGQGESRKEVQMRVRLPYDAPATAWDASNDWSSQDVDNTLKQTPNVPLYVDGKLVFGQEPNLGDPIPVTGISLTPESSTIKINEQLQLGAAITPQNATDKEITWTSSAPDIASVTGSGLVTGHKNGNAVITATTKDGSFTATASITISTEVVKLFTITASAIGSGSVELSPPGGSYNEGTSVTIKAVPNANHQFSKWSGDLTDSANPLTIKVAENLSLTANFTQNNSGSECETSIPINLPFTHEGSGQFCWVTSGVIKYINSWNCSKIEINGIDFTNKWSNELPEKVDGNYYITFVGESPQSHFEIAGAPGEENVLGFQKEDHKLLVYPNPANSGFVTIESPTNFEVISVSDLTGRKVVGLTTPHINKINLQISQLKPGIYFVKIYGEGEIKGAKRLIIR